MVVSRRGDIIGADETQQKPLISKLAAVDLFTKPNEDYSRTQTFYGGLLSVFTIFIIVFFALFEICAYVMGWDAYRTELSVDTSISTEIDVNIDILFPKLHCHEVFLDVLDVTGTFAINVAQNLQRIPVNVLGEPAFVYNGKSGSLSNGFTYNSTNFPYEAEYCGKCVYEKSNKFGGNENNVCCRTCEEVMRAHDEHGLPRPDMSNVEQCAYELSVKNPGCNFKGTIVLKKANGMIVFAPRIVGSVVRISDVMTFDSSHVIKKFSIGNDHVKRFLRRGVHYPLNGHVFKTEGMLVETKYFLKVVPTTYFTMGKSDSLNSAYEYSVQSTSQAISLGMGHLPSVTFAFDFCPIQINNYFERPPLYHFFVQLCGITGGLFVVLRLMDSLVVWLVSHYSRA